MTPETEIALRSRIEQLEGWIDAILPILGACYAGLDNPSPCGDSCPFVHLLERALNETGVA